MKKLVSCAVFAAVTSLLHSAAYADAPFGIEMGYALENLNLGREIEKDRYLLSSVPSPHSLIRLYTALADKPNGVCELTGYIPIDERGTIDRAFATLSSQMDESYGNHATLYRTADPNEIEVQVWISTGNIERAGLHLYKGTTSQTRALMVQFTFENIDRCLYDESSYGQLR
jgi:hypothetical protein